MTENFIYQIFYDEKTKSDIENGFIPIDNSNSQHPDLFEFWVILKYLRENDLNDNARYGFLSPKFNQKTGLDSKFIFSFLNKTSADTDVCLFSPAWDQLAYFANPWEQGEIWHPGLLKTAQEFTDWCRIEIDLKKVIADSKTSVFSNYVIANKRYWQAWRIIAERFYEYLYSSAAGADLLGDTFHGARTRLYPMRTFVQERIPTLVLLMNDFKVEVPVQCSFAPIQPRIFADGSAQRDAFLACDFMKQRFNESADEDYLKMYWKIRDIVKYNPNAL
jgi:hypothetical protein